MANERPVANKFLNFCNQISTNQWVTFLHWFTSNICINLRWDFFQYSKCSWYCCYLFADVFMVYQWYLILINFFFPKWLACLRKNLIVCELTYLPLAKWRNLKLAKGKVDELTCTLRGQVNLLVLHFGTNSPRRGTRVPNIALGGDLYKIISYTPITKMTFILINKLHG